MRPGIRFWCWTALSGPCELYGYHPLSLCLVAGLIVRDLVDRGLLHHDRRTNRYDLHPIVRRYAYDRLTAGDRSAALDHAQKARDLAACDGPPDYTYQVAYDEALALVRELEP
jgi:hypothetical protein